MACAFAGAFAGPFVGARTGTFVGASVVSQPPRRSRVVCASARPALPALPPARRRRAADGGPAALGGGSTSLPQRVQALAVDAARTLASLYAFVLLERGARLAGLPLPAPLSAMLALLATCLAARAARQGPAVDATLRTVFAPGAAFLARWLAVFFVPNLVLLPLAPRFPAPELAKLAALIIVGYMSSLFASIAVTSSIRSGLANPAGPPTPPAAADAEASQKKKNTPPPPPPSNTLIASMGITSAVAFMATVAGVGGAWPARVYGAVVTVLAFALGQRMSKKVKAVLHPLVTCTVLTMAAMWALGAATGMSFSAALAAYYTRGAPALAGGGGNVLAALLGPAVVSFALQMDARRRLLRERLPEVVGTAFIGSAFGLFGTAALARLAGVSHAMRLMLIPRQVTVALAIPIAELLGAHVGMAATIVAVTGLFGANVAAQIMTSMGIKDPVTRGLAAGVSAHGLGTAAMAEETEAFPFAALAMALVGIFSTVLVAAPPVRALLLRVALGSAARLARVTM